MIKALMDLEGGDLKRWVFMSSLVSEYGCLYEIPVSNFYEIFQPQQRSLLLPAKEEGSVSYLTAYCAGTKFAECTRQHNHAVHKAFLVLSESAKPRSLEILHRFEIAWY